MAVSNLQMVKGELQYSAAVGSAFFRCYCFWSAIASLAQLFEKNTWLLFLVVGRAQSAASDVNKAAPRIQFCFKLIPILVGRIVSSKRSNERCPDRELWDSLPRGWNFFGIEMAYNTSS